MVVVRIGLRLRFTKVPGVNGERVFRDTMTLTDPHDRSYQDLSDMVERKLRFMDIPSCEFTVFHSDSKTGDRLVVDDAYLTEILERMVDDAAASSVVLGTESIDDAAIVDKSLAFEVEVNREKPVESTTTGSEQVVMPLTTGALEAHTNAGGGAHIAIGALTCPPRYANFFLRAVLLAIRFKTPRSDLTVCEIDFADVDDPQQQITAVSFDAAVQKAVRENLRGDRKQVVELRNVYVRAKNDTEKRFQFNTHSLLIRMDRGSKVEVVQILPVPLSMRLDQVVTVRERMRPVSLVNLSDLAGLRDVNEVHPIPLAAGSPKMVSLGSSSSSSTLSGARRTMLSLSSAGASTTLTTGVVPSRLGEQMKQQQVQFLAKRVREDPLPLEPDTIRVSHKDVRMRDAVVAQQTHREETQKERIRRRKEVSQACIICGVNCEDPSSISVVENLLKNNIRNKGRHIPTMDDLRISLSDRRLTKEGKPRNRLVCVEHFVDLRTRTVHVVHCRCAHLCAGYQSGTNMEDVVFCELPMQTCQLCEMPGASVSCYHPDCNEKYHVICALYSGGYVNFGNKDPYLPCAACPRHTQVVVKPTVKRGIPPASRDNAWWEEDNVVFDSRVVEDTDLRDPDENDGA